MKKTIDYKYGKISYLTTDIYIGKALEKYGEREDIEAQFICSLAKAGDAVVDVGANIGCITIPVAQKVGEHGMVFAFEPQPEMFSLLKENMLQNELDVSVHCFGLGSATGQAGLPKVDYDQPNNFGGCALMEGTSVTVVTLDSLELEKCNLIKIDVEGMESEVLRGAEKTIRRHRPLLYVENDRYQHSVELISLIKSFNYELYWFAPQLFNPDNFNKDKDNIFPGVIAVNMVCVPAERHIEQTNGLRRVTSPWDRETGQQSQLPVSVRPSNGWAGVARFGGIGDNLMACSAIGALKRKGFKVEVITSADCAWQIFQHNPNIDKLSIKTKSEMPQYGVEWQKFFRGRADEYDLFAHLSHSCEGLLAFFPASTQFHWPAHVRRKIADKNYLEMVHDIAGVGYDFGPLFFSSEIERAHAIETKKRVGDKVVAIAMSGSRNDKLHPILPGIVVRLINEVGVPVVLLGDERNFNDGKTIESFVRDTNGTVEGLHVAISTTPQPNGNREIDWPIRRSLAFCQACDLVIGPDTGIMWAVAFEQMPKIMLLGHASPENITKHWVNTATLTANSARVPCYPCHQLHDTMEFCTPNAEKSAPACISDISVEMIIREAREQLAGKGTYGVKPNLEFTPHKRVEHERQFRTASQIHDRRNQDNSAA